MPESPRPIDSSSTSPSPTISILPPAPVMKRNAMRTLRGVRSDLGVRSLLPEWRAMLSRHGLREDLIAGLTVACIALPLSLAIALASDVPPAVGLTTAIIAGIAVALFGGQQLGVSGPAAAMAVLLGQIVDTHGLGGLLFVGLGCGLLQIATGTLGIGRVMRLVPLSVVHGFTAGIGVLILVGQLPRALGLPSPDESHVLDVVSHIAEYLTHANPIAVAISGSVVLGMVLVPRRWPKIPTALIAVAIPTAIVTATGADVPLLGEIPRGLPAPSLPDWPRHGVLALVGDVFVVYALASLESLLSASAVDKLRGPGAPSHDADQELVGQGIGNVAVSLFGGIPVTSVIARSALNVQSGARTRRAAIIHALALIACVYLVPDLVASMPIAALAGVLLATGIRMLDTKYLRELWHAARVEAVVFLVTVFTMVAFDLLVGVQAGLIAALVVAVLRLSRVRGELHPAHDGTPHHMGFSGPLTFLTTTRIDELRGELAGLDAQHGLVLDLRHVDSIDASAASSVIELATAWRARGGRVALLGPNAEVERRLLAIGEDGGVRESIAYVEEELDKVIGRRSRSPENAHQRLTRGVERFRDQVRGQLSPLLDRLAVGQAPHTLFLTCADSRVNPSLITGSQPGELFVVRNIGALLPPAGSETLNDEGAALEYAVRVLGVRNVVVCGHSKCGAMTALREGGGKLGDLPALAHWAKGASVIAGDLAAAPTLTDATQACSVRQLEHLRSYPVVAQALATGELRIQAWYYDMDTADVLEWDPDVKRYVPVGGRDDTR
ncbi:bifunctional SulP family inorganic anion transporter/carbonic anhydrase [Sandaracinus amylolyticus]|uniref:bifunctional SulP family inorganic anion transporter/carbonic anhydrase n=1 Tax=Sandaracinus amylolyticus TaxID=927083 RepID=UPI001F459CA7|nr:bifunctional SulP family inorganic anion transporter/carbonic anhydrase [Sandaracinus amylolyticus]UJR84343.1 Hypothetical protein I5071_64220 [Sandaracinus amylolyticus]